MLRDVNYVLIYYGISYHVTYMISERCRQANGALFSPYISLNILKANFVNPAHITLRILTWVFYYIMNIITFSLVIYLQLFRT